MTTIIGAQRESLVVPAAAITVRDLIGGLVLGVGLADLRWIRKLQK